MHPLSRFFQKIKIDENINNINKCLNKYNTGKIFPIINISYYKNIHKIDNIYITPWDELSFCYSIKEINKISDCIKSVPYYSSKQLNNIYCKYGPFDIAYFIPICSLLLYHFTDVIQPRILDVHLIHKNIIYFYDKYGVYISSKLSDTSFTELSDFKLLFDPIFINEYYFNLALKSKLNKIQFILAACGYSRYIDENGYIFPKGYSDIDSLDKLRGFLLNSRQYSRLIKNKGIIYERY